MSLTLPKKPDTATQLPARRSIKSLFSWLFTWDIYPILLVAGFLRLYQLNVSEFDSDQAAIYSMAREAVRYGLLPIVSNRASIGIENPPAVLYLLMLPASLSADPLWAVVMVGLFNTVAVLLTYFFTRRYYGRLAGMIAALLYAAAAKPLNYSRFIWQQNMLAPVILLFLFALFWGVVERRKGWLFPALFLLGIAYQLHETSTLLIIPLLVAIVLAPGTLRWRDLAFALVSLLIIFSTYMLWEYSSHFADVSIVLNVAKLPAHIDNTAYTYYRYFISPYGFNSDNQLPANPAALLRLFAPLLYVLRYLLLLLALGGLATAALLALWPRRKATSPIGDEQIRVVPPPFHFLAGNAGILGAAARNAISMLRNWWTDFRAAPYRCGLMLLFAWQVVPVLILSRHAVVLFPYYLLILMPGPFMLMGIFIAQAVKWTQLPGLAGRREPRRGGGGVDERWGPLWPPVGGRMFQSGEQDAGGLRDDARSRGASQIPTLESEGGVDEGWEGVAVTETGRGRPQGPPPHSTQPPPLRDDAPSQSVSQKLISERRQVIAPVAVTGTVLRYATYALAAFVVIAQLVTCTATLIDWVQGTNGHGKTFNSLGSLQHALSEADQLAQQRHLNRVYMTTDANLETATRYLAEQMHTPTTLFDDSRCLVLPNPTEGPAVLLVSPYAQLTQVLLDTFATATLVDQPPRLGSLPFKLFIVTPRQVVGQPPTSGTFTDNLQLLTLQRQQLGLTNPSSWLVSRWSLLRAAQPGPRTTYNYAMTALTNRSNNYASSSLCTFTAIRPGDQLLVAFSLPSGSAPPTQATIMGQYYTTTPYNPYFGALHLQTDQIQFSPRIVLRASGGGDGITIPLGV